MQEKADELCRVLRRELIQLNQSVPKSKRRRAYDADSEDVNDQRIELIHAESNFNFIKIHQIANFHYHIYRLAIFRCILQSLESSHISSKSSRAGNVPIKLIQPNRFWTAMGDSVQSESDF